MAADPVAAAIATTEQRDARQQSWAGQFRLPSSGRMVQLVVPAELTAVEALEIVGFVSTELPKQLAQARQGARSRILVPQ